MLLAFITGLISSVHCVGMCGPIALALPVGGLSERRVWTARILYNLGRVASYGVLGLCVGVLGERLSLFGWQRQISLVAGLFILFFALGIRYSFFNRLIPIKSVWGKLLQRKQGWAYATVGLLNGLLPCGMVYVALAGALTTTSPLDGLSYMVSYGLGTIPAMLSIAWVWRWVSIPVRQKINRFLPVFTLVLALLFIWRGLGLGLPYSPTIPVQSEAPVCHT